MPAISIKGRIRVKGQPGSLDLRPDGPRLAQMIAHKGSRSRGEARLVDGD